MADSERKATNAYELIEEVVKLARAHDRCGVSEAGSAMLTEAAGKLKKLDSLEEAVMESASRRGPVQTIDLTPNAAEIANLVRYVQTMHREGNHLGAFNLLSAGWPQMQIGKAVELLNGAITLEEALGE